MGLQHGDDSVWEFIHCGSGEQVCEVQGKIDPLTFADLGAAIGTWYNGALLGIENNQDGGANRALFNLGYQNIYYEHTNQGRPYDKATPRLGINMNARRRSELISHSRRLLEDGSLVIRSSRLVGQMESFALNGVKYEAISGAHDDLVMAYLIAGAMTVYHLEVARMSSHPLLPMVDGKEVDGPSEEKETLPRKLARHVMSHTPNREVWASSAENLI